LSVRALQLLVWLLVPPLGLPVLRSVWLAL